MAPNDGWRWSQADYATPRALTQMNIQSRNAIGYVAVSDDGAHWRFFVPEGPHLIAAASEAEARAAEQLLPSDGSLTFPTPQTVRFVRVYHRGLLIDASLPLGTAPICTWQPADSEPATEATMRAILAELKRLNERLGGRLAH